MRLFTGVKTAVPGATCPRTLEIGMSYMGFSRWTQNGVFDRVYTALSEGGLQNTTEYGLDSTSAKVHPDAFGCLKKTASRQ